MRVMQRFASADWKLSWWVRPAALRDMANSAGQLGAPISAEVHFKLISGTAGRCCRIRSLRDAGPNARRPEACLSWLAARSGIVLIQYPGKLTDEELNGTNEGALRCTIPAYVLC